MPNTYSYPYTVEQQEGGEFLVQFLDFENGFTQGSTKEQAVIFAEEVLWLLVDYALSKGEVLPVPSPANGKPIALVQAGTSRKV